MKQKAARRHMLGQSRNDGSISPRRGRAADALLASGVMWLDRTVAEAELPDGLL